MAVFVGGLFFDVHFISGSWPGDDYCEILPPLSWFAFDWPTRAQHNQKERVPWQTPAVSVKCQAVCHKSSVLVTCHWLLSIFMGKVSNIRHANLRFHLRCWFSRTGCDSAKLPRVCVFFWASFFDLILQVAKDVKFLSLKYQAPCVSTGTKTWHFGLYRTCTQRTRRCIRPLHCIFCCKYLSWSALWVQPVD